MSVMLKTFDSPFLVDKPKLSRITNIIEKRFEEANQKAKITYVLLLKDRKALKLHALEDVLNLDNTVNNPITYLEISTKHADSENKEVSNNCKIEIVFKGFHKGEVEATVSGDNSKWVNQTFAEIEEQLERTLLRQFVYKYLNRDSTVIIGLISTLTLLLLLVAVIPKNKTVYLNAGEIDNIITKYNNASSLEKKIDFLYFTRMTELANAKSESVVKEFSAFIEPRVIYIVAPILIIIACFVYVVGTCYPVKVFLWGDTEEHYNNLVAKRKIVWTVIVAAFAVTVVGNIFSLGLSKFIH